MTYSEILLPEFDQEMSNTRKMLAAIPDGRFDYQPHAKSMTLGRLASHVAEIPGWATMTLASETVDIPADYKPEVAASRAEVLSKFDKAAAEARGLIQKASDQDWEKTWKLSFGGRPFLSMVRMSVMRGMVMNHLVHHRAQLGVYLRMNEIPVPGMYGPSADEPNTWTAAAAS